MKYFGVIALFILVPHCWVYWAFLSLILIGTSLFSATSFLVFLSVMHYFIFSLPPPPFVFFFSPSPPFLASTDFHTLAPLFSLLCLYIAGGDFPYGLSCCVRYPTGAIECLCLYVRLWLSAWWYRAAAFISNWSRTKNALLCHADIKSLSRSRDRLTKGNPPSKSLPLVCGHDPGYS